MSDAAMGDDFPSGKFTVRGTMKLTYIDEELLGELCRDARWERAIQLRAARKDPERERYKQFRNEYVTKDRWLHSGAGVSQLKESRPSPPDIKNG